MLELSAFGHVARDCPKKKNTLSSIDRDLLTDTTIVDDSSRAVDLSGFYFNALSESGLGPLSDEILMHLENWSRQWCSSIGHSIWSSARVFSRVELEDIDRWLLDLGFFFFEKKKRYVDKKSHNPTTSSKLSVAKSDTAVAAIKLHGNSVIEDHKNRMFGDTLKWTPK